MMPSWPEALIQFELHLRQSGLAPNTIANYLLDIKAFAAWVQQAEPSPTIAGLASADVAAYKRYLLDARGRSPASVNRILQSLRKFGRFLQQAGLRQDNPAQDVALLAHTSQHSLRPLTKAQVQQLIAVAGERSCRTAARDHLILHLLVHAGLRAAEVTCLQVGDLSITPRTATLTIRDQGKTPSRTVPLNEATQVALNDYLDHEPSPDDGSTLLFCGRNGAPLSIRSVQQIVANLGNAAGLDITAKTLRNTYAAELWRTTGDLDLLLRRLGIRRPETALKYISVRPEKGLRSESMAPAALGA